MLLVLDLKFVVIYKILSMYFIYKWTLTGVFFQYSQALQNFRDYFLIWKIIRISSFHNSFSIKKIILKWAALKLLSEFG